MICFYPKILCRFFVAAFSAVINYTRRCLFAQCIFSFGAVLPTVSRRFSSFFFIAALHLTFHPALARIFRCVHYYFASAFIGRFAAAALVDLTMRYCAGAARAFTYS